MVDPEHYNLDDSFRAHIEEYHAFKKEDLVRMVQEHLRLMEWIDEYGHTIDETNRNVHLIADELYGPVRPTAADPNRRDGGLTAALDRIEKQVQDAIRTGVTTKRQWTQGQWAYAAALITAAFAFVARAWFGG